MKSPFCKTRQYQNTFFPYGIKIWNLLSNDKKSKLTLSSFKFQLKKKDKPKRIYYYGSRLTAIHHARLRMGCSLLNGHLSLILHVKDDPNCVCGLVVEKPKHYFLECPLYAGPRVDLITEIARITDCNVNILLFGDNTLSFDDNKTIFQSVHKYIHATKRFSQ